MLGIRAIFLFLIVQFAYAVEFKTIINKDLCKSKIECLHIAQQTISGMIYSKVDSTFDITKIDDNKEYKKIVKNKIKITSKNIPLIGIKSFDLDEKTVYVLNIEENIDAFKHQAKRLSRQIDLLYDELKTSDGFIEKRELFEKIIREYDELNIYLILLNMVNEKILNTPKIEYEKIKMQYDELKRDFRNFLPYKVR